MTASIRTKIRNLVRRGAAKILAEYLPPELANSEELFHALQSAIAMESSGGEWTTFTRNISSALQTAGVNAFLRLRPIAKTVHPRIRSHGREYLEYVFQSDAFTSSFQSALTESPVGKPLVNPYYPLSSPLLVQQGYHLVRLLESTQVDLGGLQLIADFGGGYGSFFRLLRNLGYRNEYIICDLPVMCALQKFYLRNLFPTGPDAQPPSNLRWLSSEIPAGLKHATQARRPSLFVATWSLSETPVTTRDAVAPALGNFDYILCAYQRHFGRCDNVQWFTTLERSLPQFSWIHAECPIYKNNFYLIGRKTTAG